ncbi:arylamine N-acetyltransferase [Streptomyces sp. NPDC094466]|uniref:arylamine N-acetyltransferase family protein n=1 Tax=Streptomyces sp. NPDC094466 TaxID=3366065 RepID=UPI00380E815D
MFDVDAYLRRLGRTGPRPGPDLDTLRTLHKQHLMTLPYNVAGQGFADGVHLVDVDEDETFRTGVLEGLGGTCFQLNRLFFRLLSELGYEVSLLAASTAEGRENFGTEIEHMFILAVLDGEEWLVDVGYPGPSYLEPLRVGAEVQNQYGCQYRLVRTSGEDGGDGGDDAPIAVQRRGRVTRWGTVYTFRPRARQWHDWKELEDRARAHHATASAADSQGVLCGRSFDNGQVVLKGHRYLVVRDGREQARTVVDEEEHRRLVAAIRTGDLDPAGLT